MPDRFTIKGDSKGLRFLRDEQKDRIVAVFFADKDKPGAAVAMLQICCAALNAENSRFFRKEKSHVSV